MAIPGRLTLGAKDILQLMAIDVTCMVITGAKQDGVVENLVEDSDLIYEDC
jgi:soluble P-type ATPase